MEKKVLNIVFDADDTIFDTEKLLKKRGIPYFNKKGLEMVNEKGYNIKEMFNCTNKEQLVFWMKIFVEYSLLLKPKNNFVPMLEKIKKIPDIEINFSICTAKYKSEIFGLGFLIKFFFELGLEMNGIKKYIKDIHYCSYELSPECKRKFAIENNTDIFAEDNIHNIEALKDVCDTICMTTSNNSDYNFENTERVHNVNQLYAVIMERIDKILERESIFTTFKHLSKEQRNSLSVSELLEYYKKYREYLINLPFDSEKLEKSEKFYNLAHKTLGRQFESKYQPMIIGNENIPQNNGNIFVANHQCDKDLLLILSIMEKPWHVLAKEELSEGKFGFLMNGVNSIFVDRDNIESKKDSIVEMAKMQIHGGNLWIFPEGTYTSHLTDDIVAPFVNNSHCYLAQMLNAPIIPVSLTQAYNQGLKPIIHFHKPIEINIEDDLDKCNKEINTIIKSSLEKDKVLQLKLK